MAQTREIKGKIKTVQSTQKITRAMEMVAASKLHKAKQRMLRSRPYAEKIFEVIRHVAAASSEYKPSLLTQRPIKRVGYLIISSDTGLCGGLNTNLFRATLKSIKQHTDRGKETSLFLIGAKAENFFKSYSSDIIAQISPLANEPTLLDFVGVVKAMLDAYDEERIDAVFLCFNRFVNTMTQKPTIFPFLPLLPVTEEDRKLAANRWDYLYEPDSRSLLDIVLNRYIESEIYQAVLENVACKHAAQMLAMKSATDNAAKMIDDLKLAYNKARQTSITSELAEIVAGAEALN